MIRLGVIGLGTIFVQQKKALDNLKEEYHVTAVCDTDHDKLNLYAEFPVADCVEDFLQNPQMEAVLIATPPATHYHLAMQCMLAGKHVLLEKPAVLSMNELEQLYQTAKEQHVLLHIAYHAAFAVDLKWYLTHAWELADRYRLGSLKTVECRFFDPYMEKHGMILPQKRPLCGSLIDSGVNILSVCDRLVNLSDFQLTKREEEKDTPTEKGVSPLTYASRSEYTDGTCTIIMHTGWNRGLNQKTTLLSFTQSHCQILLDHSNQCAVLLDGTHREILFSDNSSKRLVRHYTGVFEDFHNAYIRNISNSPNSMEIHRKLFSFPEQHSQV